MSETTHNTAGRIELALLSVGGLLSTAGVGAAVTTPASMDGKGNDVLTGGDSIIDVADVVDIATTQVVAIESLLSGVLFHPAEEAHLNPP